MTLILFNQQKWTYATLLSLVIGSLVRRPTVAVLRTVGCVVYDILQEMMFYRILINIWNVHSVGCRVGGLGSSAGALYVEQTK